MELHKNTTEYFLEYLLRHNYPRESIALNWGNSRSSVDVAVLAEDGITPVTIFEIKGKKNKETIQLGIKQLKKAVKIFDVSVQCNLVFGINSQPYFEVVNVTDAIYADYDIDYSLFECKNIESVPISYEIMNISAQNKVIQKKHKEKEEKKDHIKFMCWIVVPFVAIILLFLDAFKVYEFNTYRLVALGAIVIVVLLPFFSEFTLLDFSFKRK